MDIKEINRTTIARFRAGEELGNGMHRERLVLLTTTGRRTGVQRTSPMMFHRDGDPQVGVELDGDSFRGTATPLQGAERDRVWAELKRHYPFFADHEAGTARTIPVVAITR